MRNERETHLGGSGEGKQFNAVHPGTALKHVEQDLEVHIGKRSHTQRTRTRWHTPWPSACPNPRCVTFLKATHTNAEHARNPS